MTLYVASMGTMAGTAFFLLERSMPVSVFVYGIQNAIMACIAIFTAVFCQLKLIISGVCIVAREAFPTLKRRMHNTVCHLIQHLLVTLEA